MSDRARFGVVDDMDSRRFNFQTGFPGTCHDD
jgi:hypothetical protein